MGCERCNVQLVKKRKGWWGEKWMNKEVDLFECIPEDVAGGVVRVCKID
jgi:hypothetical protein